jgi:hypothetical protein
VNNSQHLNVLRRLFYLQCFSMPRFVASASPHVVAGDEHLLTVIERIVSRQEYMASLVADAILAREGRLPRATFPRHFTGLHNLEMRYLLTRLLEEQRAIVSELDAAATILAGDAEAQERANYAGTRLCICCCLKSYVRATGRLRPLASTLRAPQPTILRPPGPSARTDPKSPTTE